MSEATDVYLAELEAAEARAAGVLDDAEARDGDGPDGLNARAGAALRHTRKILKQHKAAVQRVRDEVRAELAAERKVEAAWRNAGIPEAARTLFAGLDPTDSKALQARTAELAGAGITWNGQPQPAPPPPPDPNLAAQQQMQAAAAGAVTMESAGDLADRLRRQAANPAAYSDEQRSRTVDDYNRAVQAAARQGTSGARG